MQLEIVLPAHNEERRIGRTLQRYCCALSDPGVRFVVALDGCTDGTAAVVQRHRRVDPRIGMLELPKLGKGGAVAEALRRTSAPLVAFVDADGATPPSELLRLVDAVADDHADIAIASRWHPAAVLPARRSVGRQLTSAGFAGAIRALFGLPHRDTQCGAKVLRRRAVDLLTPLLSSRDFLVDVDLLVSARDLGLRVAELPTVWVDQDGSKVAASRDARRMAASALRLWLHRRVLPRPVRGDAPRWTPATASVRPRPVLELVEQPGSSEADRLVRA
jgi:glycosyltransferase involved in cell wall biosynthesis